MKKIKIKVWSQSWNYCKIKIREKSSSDATNIEVDATSTIANGWEELTLDFEFRVLIIIKEWLFL
jgi:hypothetical protein